MKAFRIRSITSITLALLILLCTACGGGNDTTTPAPTPDTNASDIVPYMEPAIIGSWAWDGAYDYTYVFRGDGTGAYTYGEELTFDYVDNGDSVSIHFTNSTEPNVFHYTVNGVLLYIEDSFGQYVTYNKTDENGNKLSPFALFDINYTPAQTTAMSTFMSGGYYAVCDDTVFGLGHDAKGNALFVRFDLKLKGDFPEVADYTIIEKNVVATYVTPYKNDIYYVRDGSALYKVSQSDLKPVCIINSPVDYFQIVGDTLYFCNEDYIFCKADLDGRNIEPVLYKAVYYPYLLDENWLIFQDDADLESLHIIHLPTDVEAVVWNEPSFNPIMVGSTVYFAATEGYDTLARSDLDAMEIIYDSNTQSHIHRFTVETNGKQIPGYFTINKDGYCNVGKKTGHRLDYWTDIENLDLVDERLYTYNGMDYDIEWEYDSDGKISHIYVSSHATNGSQTLPRFK